MTIGGEAVTSPTSIDVEDPATNEVVGRAPDCTREQLDTAFDAAARAFPAWRDDEDGRRGLISKAAEVIEGAADELAVSLTAEQGKPAKEARNEIGAVLLWLRYFADLEVESDVVRDDKRARAEVVRRPIGVVAAITPWNFPVALVAWKLGPALRAGNTVVLKPSPYTPLTTLRIGELLRDVLPAGVVNVVSGGDELGAWMTAHKVPRKISFTGSVATGRKVALSAAEDLKRVTLELGGNDPAIILDDADPEAIADRLFWDAFMNCGQICCAAKRVYAPERIYDQVVDALAARADATRVGPGSDPETTLGPLNNKPQLERVAGLVSDAVEHGGRVVTGGTRPDGPGYFYPPTIVAGVSEGVRLVDEEQFGPALPVIPYRDLEDALARANATTYGLSGSVWGTDVDRAADIAARLECGTASVNAHFVNAPDLPFGGVKWSGIGVENGRWGLAEFTTTQVLYRAKPRS